MDIGTVTCRLLLAQVDGMQLTELARRCEITNLGIGVDKTGVLREDAIQRVVAQIAEYVQVVNSFKTSQFPEIPIVAMATSASRDAKNSVVLVEKLRALGVELSVIEGQREAALSFRGASCGFEGENLLVADIGGGSTEIVMGVGGQQPKLAHSFNIGCRRVTERFLGGNPPTAEECEAARAWARQQFAPFFAEARAQGIGISRIVAVAGTATSVVSIDKKMVEYNSAEVHKTTVPKQTLQRIYGNLRSLPLEQRKQVVGLEPARASVIVAGMGILLEVLEAAQCESFTVSESDILQGMILGACE
jgi:exopolyphosphatase / guanosine-5'-triphosphate,3'-diphosphate pyrophosphatase